MTHVTFQKPASRAAERKQRKADEAARLRAVYAAVDVRDKGRCRSCQARVSASAKAMEGRTHRHHVTFRSAGGQTTTENIVSLCAICHHEIHAYRLTCSGDANGRLTFSTEQKTWTSDPPKPVSAPGAGEGQ